MGRGRAPCCDKVGLKKGSWTPLEDMKLMAYIQKHGHGNWRALPKQAGLLRCGKSCRLRWINYLRPDIKRGNFTKEEEDTVMRLHRALGNKWSKIASGLPGRTDNEIKNVWNTHLKKRVGSREQNPVPEESPRSPSSNSKYSSPSTCSNQGSGGAGGIPPAPDEVTSRVCNESPLTEEDIIEIPVVDGADLDMYWDMLGAAAASPHSGIRSSTDRDMIRMWDVQYWDHDEQLPLLLHQPHPMTSDEQPAKRCLSASSSFSDVTHCNNMGELGPAPGAAQQTENDVLLDAGAGPGLQPADMIPVEPELWNLFEDEYSTLFDFDDEDDDIAAAVLSERGPGRDDVEGNRWIAYLEKELELPEGMPRGHRSQEIPPAPAKSTTTPVPTPNTELEDKDLEVDPIASYFRRQHSCPSPFSLSFTDISMT